MSRECRYHEWLGPHSVYNDQLTGLGRLRTILRRPVGLKIGRLFQLSLYLIQCDKDNGPNLLENA